MSIVIATKILGELCLYFGLLCCFVTFRSFSLLFGITAIVCSLTVGLARRFAKKRKYQLMTLLLLVVPYFFTGMQGKAIFVISFAVIYAAALIITNRLQVDEWTFVSFYKIVSCAILIAVFCYGAIRDDWYYFFRFAVVFIITGAAAIRQMRIGTNCGKKMEAMNYLTYFTGLLAGGIGAGVIVLTIRFSGKILEFILTPIGMALEWASRFFIFLDPAKHSLEETVESVEETMESVEHLPEVLPIEENVIQELAEDPALDKLLLKIFTVVGILIVTSIGFYFIYGKIKENRDTLLEEEDDCFYETLDYQEKKVKKTRYKKGNREKIRSLYRKTLEQMKRRGVAIYSKDTTEDILQKEAFYRENEAARELRELYIRVRYQEDGEIPDETVVKAKKLAKEVINL